PPHLVFPPARAPLPPDFTINIANTILSPSPRLDYYNSLLIGRPPRRLSLVQSIMNAAARLIHLTNRSVFTSPLCQSLH
ncbi:unnamed protein product, partial [Staurois parvus]